jgi:hypothetical protein
VVQVILAGAAAVATFALLSTALPLSSDTAAASGPFPLAAPSMVGGGVIAVDDTGVNDQGQTSGDIFTQNAQDQSTA